MPVYSYKCLSCNHAFDRWHRTHGEAPPHCPECAGEVKKQISRTSFELKGEGWAKDNYGLKKG